jgi:GAF domain-containing protein
MLCVVIEDTERVIGARQLAALSTLAATLAGTITEQDVFSAVERGVAGQKDMPCTLTYLFDANGRDLKLATKTGFAGDHPAAPKFIDGETKIGMWPIEELLAATRAVTVENLADSIPSLPHGCWEHPPARARMVPLMRRGQEKPAGVFIAALNPYRQLDASYSGFLDLVAGQIAASVTNAQAYEEERQRAFSAPWRMRSPAALLPQMNRSKCCIATRSGC